MKTVDCRGMACPQPVVAVKHMLEESKGEPINVMLDDGAPRENVTRFAVNRGFSVAETAINGAYSLLISGEAGEPMVTVESRSGKTVMLVASDRLGDGPEELGRLLMKNFIITLLDQDEVPDLILFVNTGVLLTSEGSEVVEALGLLGNRGVEVLSCGVCLDYFHCKEKLAAGNVTNMFTIAESMLRARSVIRI